MTRKFLGRAKELSKLRNVISEHSNGIMIYGPRRVGKTALIKEAMRTYPGVLPIYFECTKGSFEYNIELLAREAAETTGRNYIAGLRDIFSLFDALKTESEKKPIVIAIDEYPYLRETMGEGVIDSFFQRIIDSLEGYKFTIILSGSHITAMVKLLEESSPLFGRFRSVINLLPFSYLEASAFYPSLKTINKFSFYSVFGGFPYVLTEINEDETLEENISRLLLDNTNPVRLTLENVILSECGRSGLPIEILSRIGNGKLRFSEIESMIRKDVSGTLDKTLKTLVGMDILEKTVPINRKNERKKTFYEIKDNLLRFFFTYIQPRLSRSITVSPDDFISTFITPSLNTFISKRFEGIVREYFKITSPATVEDIGTYWYDNPKTRSNGEFDSAIKLVDGTYEIWEVKLLSNPMDYEMYEEERRKILGIKEIPVSKIGFVSSSGYDFNTEELPDKFLTAEDIYRKNNDFNLSS